MAEFGERGKQIILFLDEKMPNLGPCPLCKKEKWTVSDTVWELQELFEGELRSNSPRTPVICLTCGNCGNTILINAIIAGIVKSEAKGGQNG